MKIVLLLTLVAVLCYGSLPKCAENDKQRKDLSNHIKSVRCKGPKESFVQLKVPDGFDYVKPNVVKIPQCTGLFCSEYPMKCLPTNSRTKTQKVEAFKRGADHLAICTSVEVEEHLKCACDCKNTTCKQNEKFNNEICACECDPEYKRQCQERIAAGHRVQWSKSSCACLCSHPY
ncbi:hypothetical protein O3P69_016541 [Scylla paramamosain]|uniref:Platelet-derived growth factor (PDGF) family profile domain-containing protein n=1 Tax=Scylla paramamosain TaxID=85552 RepID=A0AAW0TE30_SCYPA